MKDLPLVSCIMPTHNRREFVPHAIRYYSGQDYPNKELIVIDDGTDKIEDLLPAENSIKYYKISGKLTLGEKLNMACKYATGSIIVHWDDDDWYSPGRITYQVDALQKESSQICGINNLLYFDIQTKKGYIYIYPKNQRIWLLGSSLCYRKSFWESFKFVHNNVGMDGLFVWNASPDQITVLPDSTFAVHMIHKTNVSPKVTTGSWWHDYPIEKLKEIMKQDWTHYINGTSWPCVEERSGSTKIILKQNNLPPTGKLKNIYLCLVHEKNDCIIDLIRNLHYHDPSSTTILYNGGSGFEIQNGLSYEQYNTVIHPAPTPQKHGYLHGFALDCMKYALENFAYDILTIVDSDQLCIRSGYSNYLCENISNINNIGLLSNSPGRISSADRTNYVANQAHKEYELWKPLLRSFNNGEDGFVHWSFWPSSIFTRDAAEDLVQLFKNNTLLRSIMQKTKIWATEEVILPTLVRLLGYDIQKNPCSYKYVKYKTNLSKQDFYDSINDHDTYWIHPVNRDFSDDLRKEIREYFNYYSRPESEGKLNVTNKSPIHIKQLGSLPGLS